MNCLKLKKIKRFSFKGKCDENQATKSKVQNRIPSSNTLEKLCDFRFPSPNKPGPSKYLPDEVVDENVGKVYKKK